MFTPKGRWPILRATLPGGFKVDYLRVERGELAVRLLGDAALMTGSKLLEAVRKANGERLRIDSPVMQVWVKENDRWQQIAFQTTPTDYQPAA